MPVQSDIITKAREITGNKEDRSVSEVQIPDAAITADLVPVVRELNRIYGTTSSAKEVKFHPVAGQQDYSIATYVGNDVYRIEEVLRSEQDFPVGALNQSSIIPWKYVEVTEETIPSGLQGDTFRAIENAQRFERADGYSWQQFGSLLRLFPVPESAAEWVYVQYTATGFSMSTLPDETEPALVFAACVAILNCELNRISSNRFVSKVSGESSELRIKTLREQRNEYRTKMLAEFGNLRKG